MLFFTDLSLIFQDERGRRGVVECRAVNLQWFHVAPGRYARSKLSWQWNIYHHSWRIYWSWMESGFSQAWYFPFEFAPELWSKFLFLCLIRRLRTYETPLELVRNDPFHRTTSSCPRTGHRHGPRVILKNIMLKLFQVIEKSIYKWSITM